MAMRWRVLLLLEAWETDLSQTLSAFLPPFLLLVYDHGTDVYGKNARDKTLE